MVSYAAIRAALAVRLRTLDTFIAVYATVPGRVVAPCAVVVPGRPIAGYHESMNGTGGQLIRFNFDVLAIVQPMAETWNQETLDALIAGAESVPAALEADPTLGGVSAAVVVTSATDYGMIQFADTEYVGARFNCEVYAR